MESKDLIKIAILLVLYGGLAPLLGCLIKSRRPAQRLVFFAMCFMTISGFFVSGEWGLTVAFDENFRGHSRGFHFFFNEALAGALIVAAFLESPRRFRWLPPGLLFYLAYVVLSFISILNAPYPLYTCMAAVKALKVAVIFIAAFNFLRTVEDVRFFVTSFAITIFWELVAVLKLKYLEHQYQVAGTFEHQNALAMYACMIGMVFLGAGVGPKHPRSKLCLAAFIASAWIVECTLSRGGLVSFALGVAGVMGLSLLEKITARRLLVVGVLTLVGSLGILLSLNTILGRFNDRFNMDSGETRRQLNHASRLMLQDHPLGIGWNNFGKTINPPFPYGDHIDEYFRAHGDSTKADTDKGIVESHYWLLLSETGYQGFLSYLALIAVFLLYNFRATLAFRSHFLGAVSLGIAMGCTANYVQSMVERVLTQPRNMTLWILLLALTARIEFWRREKKTAESRRRGGERIKITAARGHCRL